MTKATESLNLACLHLWLAAKSLREAYVASTDPQRESALSAAADVSEAIYKVTVLIHSPTPAATAKGETIGLGVNGD